MLSVLLLFAQVCGTHAETTTLPQQTNTGKTLPGEQCRIGVPYITDKWTEAETWAWQQICEGKTADFNMLLGKIDPRNLEHGDKWRDERRTLSPRFLTIVLLHEPFRAAIPDRGIYIIGAFFPDNVDLLDATLQRPLVLRRSFFNETVSLLRLRTPMLIDFKGTTFRDHLNMDSATVEGDLVMRSATFSETNMKGAEIGGQLDMSGSTFHGKLNMDSLSTGGSLLMSDAEFTAVNLKSANVGDQLATERSTFHGKLDLDSASIDGNLFMRDATFSDVYLKGAEIGGQLAMDCSRFGSRLDMASISVGDDLFMRDAEVDKDVTLVFISVGSVLDIRGANMGMLDLTGARIGSELRISSPRSTLECADYPDERDGTRPPQLKLRNTAAGALHDTKDIWPDNVELNGLTYTRLGGFGGDDEGRSGARQSDWLIDWLQTDRTFSPQPYRQLAQALREAGEDSDADDILVALQDLRRTRDSTPIFTRVLLMVSWMFLGYGYKIWLALIWFSGLVFLGFVVVSIPKKTRCKNCWQRLFYSFESAVPLVGMTPLNEKFSLELKPWVDRYFQFHKIFGFFIVSILVAGLTGFVQ